MSTYPVISSVHVALIQRSASTFSFLRMRPGEWRSQKRAPQYSSFVGNGRVFSWVEAQISTPLSNPNSITGRVPLKTAWAPSLIN
ncbi:hypothetical protein GW17_00019844 [Ensete ventricosum]|nr:hypothetical protein GW17_00019844 [Ensete ventricosum]